MHIPTNSQRCTDPVNTRIPGVFTVPTNTKFGRGRFARALVIIALVLSVTNVINISTADAAGSLLPTGPKTVDKSNANAGELLTYQIPYFCSSTILDDNCNGMLIEDVIPTFTDAFGQARPLQIVSYTSNSQLSGAEQPSPTRVVWTGTNLVAGDTGAVTLVLRIPGGLTPAAGITITNQAIYKNAGVSVPGGSATTTVPPSTPGVTVAKSDGRTLVLSGSSSTYQIRICPNPGFSHYVGYTVTDTIPAGATIVGGIPNGGVESPAGVVSWTITDANDPGYDPATGCFGRSLTLNFPPGSFPGGSTAVNSVSVQPVGGAVIGPVTDTNTIRNPEPGVSAAKSTNAGYYVKDGDPINYSVGFSNTSPEGGQGETTLQQITMTDGPLPRGFALASVNSGQWAGGYAATVEYSVNGGTSWSTLITADGSTNINAVAPSALGNPADGTQRFVRWTIAGPVAQNFAFTAAGTLNGAAEQDPFLPAPGLPATLTNCQTTAAKANVNGTLRDVASGPVCATNQLETPQPDGVLNKTVDNGVRQPGEVGTFTLATGNSSDATGDLIVSPAVPATLNDCIPNQFVINSITLNGWTDVSPGTHTCAAGKTPLSFRLSGSYTVAPGGSLPPVQVVFHVSELGDPLGAAAPGTYVNDAQLITSVVSHCTTGECRESEPVIIPVSSTMKSRKQVAGYFDPPLSGPPVPYTTSAVDVSADTYPGGPIDYRLAVLNNGNADVKNFVIIDTLPYVGDTGVKVAIQNRLSQFRVALDRAARGSGRLFGGVFEQLEPMPSRSGADRSRGVRRTELVIDPTGGLGERRLVPNHAHRHRCSVRRQQRGNPER